ncbi:MAG: DUF1249 domain-containing protein [Gammaproteobacteria bacterium]|nr:MAG: DUF1249 domain-containing protein [Gammaproteobacteria bacterium]
MRKDIYTVMHRKLIRLIPELPQIAEHAKLVAEGYMDLNVDILRRTEAYTDLALSHYYKHPSGDMIADPDMEIRVWNYGAVEALAFQDIGGYRRVYDDVDGRAVVYPVVKKSLNSFLNLWLGNLIEQGHRMVERDAP